MKLKISLLIIFLATTVGLRAATNDLTSLLQQGLFDEEASHDLTSAIADYQSLATQFDRDRQVAATAIYRLGECYRKLGQTNEAVSQYQRIIRDFADQKDLITLSQQNLTGLGASTNPFHEQPSEASFQEKISPIRQAEAIAPIPPSPASDAARQETQRAQIQGLAEAIKAFEWGLAAAQKEGVIPTNRLQATQDQIDELKRQMAALQAGEAVSPPASPAAANDEASQLTVQLAILDQFNGKDDNGENRARAVLSLFPDDDLKTMLAHLRELKANATSVAMMHPEGAPRAQQLVQSQLDSIQQRVKFIVGLQQARLQILRSNAGSMAGTPPPSSVSPVSTDEEAQEIIRIQQMIQNSPDLINVPSEGNSTPLTAAAYNGWLKVAGYLLDHGADVNAGRSPALAAAARAGNRAMTELLLSRGADVNALGSSEIPLTIAAGKGFQAVVEVLLASKANVNAPDKNDLERTPLISATRNGHGKIVQLLLTAGANPNAKADDGLTALLLAAKSGDPELTKILLAGGADPNVSDNDGRTPLLIAATGGSAECVRELLAAKADLNATDDSGRSPLYFAAASGSPECVAALLAAKADPNGGRIDAPLFGAIGKMDLAAAELLLKAGANPNRLGTVDGTGTPYSQRQRWTPIYRAVSTRQLPMVQLLLKYHADPNDEQADQRPLIFNALTDTNILETLLNAGAHVEARDTTGQQYNNKSHNWTPLMVAVRGTAYPEQNFPAESVAILLQHGANPNVPDDAFGTPPLFWSAGWSFDRLPNRRVLELLLDHQADPNQRSFDGETMLHGLKFLSNKYTPDQALIINSFIDLLHQHGALDYLPDWNHITVTRAAANLTRLPFTRQTNDWNQFTLLELVALECQFLSSSPRDGGVNYGDEASFWHDQQLPFADLSQIHLRRPEAGRTNATDQTINLATGLDSGNCANDLLLKWGDIVEIPESDHPINEAWQGFSLTELTNLNTCLTRNVSIIVKGETNTINLPLQLNFSIVLPSSMRFKTLAIPHKVSFWLGPVLLQSKLVLASSDLAHVKVTRHDPATGKPESCIVDCSSLNQNQYRDADLWLRDGDVIEVPEKP